MDEEMKANLTAGDNWLRLLWIVVLGFFAVIAVWLIWLTAIVQFVFTLFTGSSQPNMNMMADVLIQYTSEVYEYMTYRSDNKPFPFSPLTEDKIKND